jgi:hypothetical protein
MGRAVYDFRFYVTQAVKSKYEGEEEGQSTILLIKEREISLDIQPDVGIPKEDWEKDGWALSPLLSPTVRND